MKQPIENASTNSLSPRGDYELSRAKRQLERLLRQEGASKRQALEQVHEQFSLERNQK